MERKIVLIVFLLLIFGVLSASASEKSEVYKAYIQNDMEQWQRVVDDMDRQKTPTNEFRCELLNYQYGYIAWCIGNKKYDMAKRYLESAEKNLFCLERAGGCTSLVNSYRAAFYGYRIGLNFFKAPFIGPKSIECARLAMKQDADNPYGFIQYANIQYYMPAVFGGSKSMALSYYKEAEVLMEKNPDQIREDWNYLSLLSTIAEALTELNQYQKAKAYYERILKIEPDFSWVRDELYPGLLKKMK
jgi:tetratricopeptide (TPR) repeat protein